MGSLSLAKSTMFSDKRTKETFVSAQTNITNAYSYGYHAAYKSTFECDISGNQTCNIHCNGNGCNNLTLLNCGSNDINEGCNIDCKSSNQNDTSPNGTINDDILSNLNFENLIKNVSHYIDAHATLEFSAARDVMEACSMEKINKNISIAGDDFELHNGESI